MTLYLIGIGLSDEKDITLKGLEAVKRCDLVYLEHYTSILGTDKQMLEKLYGKKVLLADRDLVEKQAEEKLLEPAKIKDVALLVVGDVFGATTHTDFFLRAKKMGVNIEVIFNASIMNAVGIVGLELYKYGKTTSIVFPDEGWLPETPYDVIKENRSRGLHTLCLLDIKVAEPTIKDLKKGKTTPQAPRYMTVGEGLEVLLALERKRQEGIITKDMLAIGVARLGQHDMKIVSGTVKELLLVNFGQELHALIIPGTLHHVEEEVLEQWS